MRPATDLPIKKACPLDGDLPGTGAVRHCASCDTHVVDLSLLTAAAADRMLADPARPRCVSYRVDDDGNVIHLPTPAPPAARRRLPLLVGGLLLAACNGSAVDGAGPAPTHVAQVAAGASSSAPPTSSVPPASSTEPTEKHTRGEMAALPPVPVPAPAARGESDAGCDVDQGATATNDNQGNPSPSPPKKPKKPKHPQMRGYM